ncbi:hypothetical protein HBH61_135940 [Parastagonospora nodorum]|nr:hypothetical protein HBH61_135940 [Parastagonospora nodorum]
MFRTISPPGIYRSPRWRIELIAHRLVLTTQEQAFGDAMRESAPSFSRVMANALRTGRHNEVGALLFNIIARCWDLDAFKNGVERTPFQTSRYCALLHYALRMLSPGLDAEDLDFEELLAWLLSDAGRVFSCDDLSVKGNMFRAILLSMRSTFLKELTFSQHWHVTSGCERASVLGCPVAVPLWLVEIREPPLPEVPEDMYRNVGPPIDIPMFCQSTPSVPTNTPCPICIADVTADTNDAGQKPVVTTCGHYFHEQCLDSWVNDSAMSKSHTCPSCRAVMCVARPRIPADTPPLDWVYSTLPTGRTTVVVLYGLQLI